MENELFEKVRIDETGERFLMCDHKSRTYTRGSTNRLANFEIISEFTGISRERVLLVYMSKHILSMITWINDKTEPSDGIRSTIHDIQNYLDLLLAMAYEEAHPGTPGQLGLEFGPGTPGDVGYAEQERMDTPDPRREPFVRPERIPSGTPPYRKVLLEQLPVGYPISCEGEVPTDAELHQAVANYCRARAHMQHREAEGFGTKPADLGGK